MDKKDKRTVWAEKARRTTESEFKALTEAPTELIPDRGVSKSLWAYRIFLALGIVALAIVFFLSRRP